MENSIRTILMTLVYLITLAGCGGGDDTENVTPPDSTSVSIAPISSEEIYAGTPVTVRASVVNPQNRDFSYFWTATGARLLQTNDDLEIQVIPIADSEPAQITLVARDVATDIDYEAKYSLGIIQYHPNDFQCFGRTLTHKGTETWAACGRFKQGFVFAGDIELNKVGQMAAVYAGNSLQGHHHTFFDGDTWETVELSSVNAGLSSGHNSIVEISESGNSAVLISDINGLHVLYFQNGSLLYDHIVGTDYSSRSSDPRGVYKPIRFINNDELAVLLVKNNILEMLYFNQTGLIRTETVVTEATAQYDPNDYEIVVSEDGKIAVVGDRQSLYFKNDDSWTPVNLPFRARFSRGATPLSLEYDSDGYVSVFFEGDELDRPFDDRARYFRVKINQNGDYLELNTPWPNNDSIAKLGETSGFFANCNTFLVGNLVCNTGEFAFYTIMNNQLEVHNDDLPVYKGERLNENNLFRIYTTNGTWRSIAFFDNRYQIFERVEQQWIHRDTIDAKRGHPENYPEIDITANGYMGLAGSFVQKQYSTTGIVDEYFVGLFKFD